MAHRTPRSHTHLYAFRNWQPGEVYEATKIAIDTGYRHVDEAWIYQNEDEVGRALEEKIADGAVKRGDLFVTSKLWNNFHRPELVKKGVQESLAKLKLAHLDPWYPGFHK